MQIFQQGVARQFRSSVTRSCYHKSRQHIEELVLPEEVQVPGSPRGAWKKCTRWWLLEKQRRYYHWWSHCFSSPLALQSFTITSYCLNHSPIGKAIWKCSLQGHQPGYYLKFYWGSTLANAVISTYICVQNGIYFHHNLLKQIF